MAKLVNPPACPRCGYDFQGTISTWQASCPLLGTCSECGLEYEWSEVLNPVLRIPEWFLEHPYRRVWRTFLPTYVRVLRPAKFWGSVRLSFPVMPWRLVQFGGEVILVLHLCLAYLMIAQTDGMLWPMRALNPPSGSWFGRVGRMMLIPYWEAWYEFVPATGGPWGGGYRMVISTPFDATAMFIVLWWLLTPFQFVLLRRTMMAAKVKGVHLLRVGTYTLAPMPWLVLSYIVFENGGEGAWNLGQPAEDILWNLRDWLENVMSLQRCTVLLACVWLLWSWYHATKRYLRLPHALGVATAMMVVAGLIAMLIVVLLMGSDAASLIDAMMR